jgi:hypothetical protein
MSLPRNTEVEAGVCSCPCAGRRRRSYQMAVLYIGFFIEIVLFFGLINYFL